MSELTPCGYCRAQDHTTEQHVPFDAAGMSPDQSGRVATLQAALAAGVTPYELCACPKIENGAMATVVGWSSDCLLHEGEDPDRQDGECDGCGSAHESCRASRAVDGPFCCGACHHVWDAP